MSELNAVQYPRDAVADLGIENIATDITIPILPGTLLMGVVGFIVTAFNSATTTTLTVSDGTTTFLSAVDAKAAANTRYDATVCKFYPTGGTLTISMAETGAAATAGRAIVVPEFLNLNRTDEVVF
jgi:hypothetical protein